MPISAREPLLEIAGLSTGYGKIGVLHGIDLTVGARRGRGAARAERRRQDHAAARRLGTAALVREVHFAGRDLAGAGPRETVKAGLVHVIEGHRVFTQLTVFDNLLLAGYDLPRGERSARVEEALGLLPRDRREAQRARGRPCPAASSRCSRWRKAWCSGRGS